MTHRTALEHTETDSYNIRLRGKAESFRAEQEQCRAEKEQEQCRAEKEQSWSSAEWRAGAE